jgi:hypothetical protein
MEIMTSATHIFGGHKAHILLPIITLVAIESNIATKCAVLRKQVVLKGSDPCGGIKTLSEYIFQFTELSRYPPELVNTDAKKQTKFIEGLTYELRTLMTPQIYPDFNTLMNMTILIDVAKMEENKENKRKFLERKV